MSSFWTSFFSRRKAPDPLALPLSARVSTLEGEMLHMHQSAERTYGVLKKLQGKVYRGIALGDTTEPEKSDPEASEELVPPQPPMRSMKQELYRRAGELRRH